MIYGWHPARPRSPPSAAGSDAGTVSPWWCRRCENRSLARDFLGLQLGDDLFGQHRKRSQHAQPVLPSPTSVDPTQTAQAVEQDVTLALRISGVDKTACGKQVRRYIVGIVFVVEKLLSGMPGWVREKMGYSRSTKLSRCFFEGDGGPRREAISSDPGVQSLRSRHGNGKFRNHSRRAIFPALPEARTGVKAKWSEIVELKPAPLVEDDELVENLARFADGTLSEAAVKARHHLSDKDGPAMGESDKFVELVEARKLFRIRSGATKRERAQIEIVDGPPILGKLTSATTR